MTNSCQGTEREDLDLTRALSCNCECEVAFMDNRRSMVARWDTYRLCKQR